ncbi:MAG: PP2C family protein-serine/threonine phosphatase [Bacteroidota bacterium]
MPSDDRNIKLLQEENSRLKRAVEELSVLNDLARAIGSITDANKVMEAVIKRSIKAIGAEQGVITLVEEDPGTPMRTLVRSITSSANREQFHLSQNIVGWMLINKKPMLSNEIRADDRFKGIRDLSESIRSVLCTPLMTKNQVKGVLSIFNKKGGKLFDDDDQRLLAIIAAQSAQIIENARLYEQEREKFVLEREIVAARDVQMSLFPRTLPTIPDLDIAAVSIPAREVGGDYYDFIQLSDNHWEFVIADVSGKGLPAAMLTTMGKGMLYAQTLLGPSPKGIIINANRIFRKNLPRKSFVTMLLGTIDVRGKSMSLASAGHCPPMYYNVESKKASLLPVNGVALNLMDEPSVEELNVALCPGDVYAFYSDGITEAENNSRDQFGEERLMAILDRLHEETANGILQGTLKEVQNFVGGYEQSDDMTMIVLKVRPELHG